MRDLHPGHAALTSPLDPVNITFAFRQGAYFEDRYGLLRGVGKHARHVRMKNLGDLKKPALKYYIKQAVKLDKH
jgi:hypothetical protein